MPSKKEIAQVEREKQEKERKQREVDVKNAIRKVANTEAGRIFIRYLMGQCGFHNPSVVADRETGNIFTESTVYNEARRNLYLGLRPLIPPKNLVKIEFNLEAQKDDD